jgi:hypothetical protein
MVNKNKFRSKHYALPSGIIIKIQEKLFVNFDFNHILMIEKIYEDDIINGYDNVLTYTK